MIPKPFMEKPYQPSVPPSGVVDAPSAAPYATGCWRLGGKVPINIYDQDGVPVCQCQTVDYAKRIVAAVNWHAAKIQAAKGGDASCPPTSGSSEAGGAPASAPLASTTSEYDRDWASLIARARRGDFSVLDELNASRTADTQGRPASAASARDGLAAPVDVEPPAQGKEKPVRVLPCPYCHESGEDRAELYKLLDYARKVKGSRDVHSVYEVLDLIPQLTVKLETMSEYASRTAGELQEAREEIERLRNHEGIS